MGKRPRELTHEEIWDDSGLIESWDQSYEEYKLYHSIKARGERVEDVLALAKAKALEADALKDGDPAASQGGSNAAPNAERAAAEDTELEEEEEVEDDRRRPPKQQQQQQHQQQEAQTSNISNQRQVDMPLPSPNIGQAQTNSAAEVSQLLVSQSSNDAGLKSLMMAWYWAGYYTGLYEGQRQAGQATSNGNAD